MAGNLETQIRITAKNDTKKAFTDVGVSLKGLQGAAGAVGKVLAGAAVAGGAALVAFLYSSAKAAGEAQVQLAKVDATLKTMGASAIGMKEKILEASSAVTKLGFDDETAAVSITNLFKATGDLTKATELNNLALDIARAKNIDLETASNLVLKAYEGQTGGLRKLIPAIDGTLTPLEQLRQAQAAVAGQADAAAKTFPIQMLALSESITNLKEVIGSALLESLQPFIDKLILFANDPATVAQVKLIGEWIGTNLPIAIDTAVISIQTIHDAFVAVTGAIGDVIYGVQVATKALGDFVVASAKAVKDAAINTIPGVGLVKSVKSMITGKKAAGGPVMAGGSYLVGEQGPEIFTPGSSGHITPNGGGGAVVNIYNPMLLDPTTIVKLSEQIARLLRQDFRV